MFIQPEILYGIIRYVPESKQKQPLEEGLRTKELYRRQKLTLHSLAAEVALPPRTVSYVLNQYYKQRFTEYINKYRVEYIISRMMNNTWKELPLEGLAKEAGFSSKSTFFAVFKKYTSVSPAEYLSKLEKETAAAISVAHIGI